MSSIKKIGMILDKKLPDLRVENEADLLGNAGFEVIIFSLDNRIRKSYYEKKKNYLVYHKSCPKWYVDKLRPFSGTILDIYSILWWQLIKAFIMREEIDILHVHDLYMAVPLIGKKFPFVVDLHENYPETVVTYNWSNRFPLNYILNKKIWKEKEKKILSDAEGIVVLSENYAIQLKKEYSDMSLDSKFCVYSNVPDLTMLKNLETKRSIYNETGKFTVFYFGVIGERRGIFECFEMIKTLRNTISELHLLLVGPVDNADKQKFYTYLKDLKELVTYIEWINFQDFAALIKNVDICISPIKKNPQHESGVANKIFQYMYFEKPLIVSNCLPQEEIVINNKCGYVYKSGNADNLAEIVKLAYKDQTSFKEMGKRAKEAVKTKYNTKVMGENLVNFYREYVDRKMK